MELLISNVNTPVNIDGLVKGLESILRVAPSGSQLARLNYLNLIKPFLQAQERDPNDRHHFSTPGRVRGMFVATINEFQSLHQSRNYVGQ